MNWPSLSPTPAAHVIGDPKDRLPVTADVERSKMKSDKSNASLLNMDRRVSAPGASEQAATAVRFDNCVGKAIGAGGDARLDLIWVGPFGIDMPNGIGGFVVRAIRRGGARLR